MNLVRFACVAGLIGIFLSSFGLEGAVLVTFIGLLVTKSLGVVRIASLMHVGVRDALPWRRLAATAAMAALAAAPVRWLQLTVSWPPLVTFAAGVAVYVAVYALLNYAAAQAATWLRAARHTVPVAGGPATEASPTI
jgi:hypothetical protein